MVADIVQAPSMSRTAPPRVATDPPTIRSLRHRLGAHGALALVMKERWYRCIARLLGRQTREFVYTLRPPDSGLRLLCRAGTSDRVVFEQVFGEDQYAVEPPTPAPEFIVDCGANVGHTTAYFLDRFPGARVIALEPEPGNCHLLRRNTARFGPRVEILRAALWSHPAGLKVTQPGQADWEFAVRECDSHESADVTGVDVPTLLARSPHGRIDILKMDIEGAETEIFGHEPESWLDSVGLVLVELHGPRARSMFQKAMNGRPFVISESGEVTVARRTTWPPGREQR